MLFYRPFTNEPDALKTITNIYNLLSGNVPYSATDTNTYKLSDNVSTLDGVDYVGSITLEKIDYQTVVTKFQTEGPVITGQDLYEYTTRYMPDARARKNSWGLQTVGSTVNSNRIKFDDESGIHIGSSFNVNLREHKITAMPPSSTDRRFTMDAPNETIGAETPVFMRNYALAHNLEESNKLKLGKVTLAVDNLVLFGSSYLYKVTGLVLLTTGQYKITLTKQALSTSKTYLIGSKKYYYNGSVFVEDYLTREKVKSKVSPPTAQVLDQEQ
jgi:hypothetical protein